MHDNVAAERRDVALHPAQCSALIGLPVIAVGRAIECRMGHESERAEAVVHRNDDQVTQRCDVSEGIE